jgi:flagellar protein FliS
MSYTAAAATYRRNAILTASPEKIIQMLYEGAIVHLERSHTALQDRTTTHSAQVGESLSKAIGIVSELRSCLDHEAGGDVAQNLDLLYEYSVDEISQANISRTPEHVEHTLHVLRTLKEGWDGIIPN